jgi:ParB family chromosome partitioning protein
MEELIQSIKEKGIIQPVIVRRRGDYYELIAGERRFRAAQVLNLPEIPIIVKEAEDTDSLELSLIENIQRQDLNPIEEARAYRYLIEKFKLTQERVGEVLGKSRVSVTNTLRLLSLPQEIQEEIRKGRISFAHGRTLLELEDANQQRKLTQEIIAKGLSVRELENLVKKHRPKISKSKIRPGSRETYLTVCEEELRHALATKVRISKRKKRGHITIEFYSQEDLERIVKRIKGGKD